MNFSITTDKKFKTLNLLYDEIGLEIDIHFQIMDDNDGGCELLFWALEDFQDALSLMQRENLVYEYQCNI